MIEKHYEIYEIDKVYIKTNGVSKDEIEKILKENNLDFELSNEPFKMQNDFLAPHFFYLHTGEHLDLNLPKKEYLDLYEKFKTRFNKRVNQNKDLVSILKNISIEIAKEISEEV